MTLKDTMTGTCVGIVGSALVYANAGGGPVWYIPVLFFGAIALVLCKDDLRRVAEREIRYNVGSTRMRMGDDARRRG
jgi:uncharacterized membrane protein